MNRRDFTLVIADQILFSNKLLAPLGMALQGDWLLRSAIDQRQLYQKGLSKCDGVKDISAHQRGKALDLLLIGPNKVGTLIVLDPRESCPQVWKTIREHWESLGGAEMISWDPCHFEVK
jgi:hypothetical protein